MAATISRPTCRPIRTRSARASRPTSVWARFAADVVAGSSSHSAISRTWQMLWKNRTTRSRCNSTMPRSPSRSIICAILSANIAMFAEDARRLARSIRFMGYPDLGEYRLAASSDLAAFDPGHGHKLFVPAPFGDQCNALDLAPHVRAGMVKNDYLKLAVCANHFGTDRLEHRTDRENILIARSADLADMLTLKPAGEIDLARLIEHHQCRHRMADVGQEVTLQRQHHRDMIGQPVRAAADLPKIIGP